MCFIFSLETGLSCCYFIIAMKVPRTPSSFHLQKVFNFQADKSSPEVVCEDPINSAVTLLTSVARPSTKPWQLPRFDWRRCLSSLHLPTSLDVCKLTVPCSFAWARHTPKFAQVHASRCSQSNCGWLIGLVCLHNSVCMSLFRLEHRSRKQPHSRIPNLNLVALSKCWSNIVNTLLHQILQAKEIMSFVKLNLPGKYWLLSWCKSAPSPQIAV